MQRLTMRLLINLIILFLLSSIPSMASTNWYVRDGGGTSSQCTGTNNAVYPGSGSAQPCAFNHPAWAIGTPGVPAKMAGGDTLYIVGDSDNTWNFTVSGVSTLPAVGDEYTANGVTYTVMVTLPPGATSGNIAMAGTTVPPASGTLTVVYGHGSGTSPITYTAESIAKAEYMIGYGMPNTVTSQCSSAGAYQCIMSTVPEGTSSSIPTRILGLVGSDGLMPQLWGTEGVNWILDLTGGGNYDVENLEITQHSSCSGAVVVTTIDSSIYPAGCGNGGNGSTDGSYPFGPSVASSTWGKIGIEMIGTNFTTVNLWVHNIGLSAVNFNGTVSNWNDTNSRWIAAGDSLTQSFSGLMAFGGTNSMTNVVWAWGGCQEKYPLPDPGNLKDLNNYINCADQGYSESEGGSALGGGFMQQNDGNGACGNWNISYSQFLFNLKTNVDFLHCDGTGQVNVYRSRFEGSTGETFKASVGGVNLEESQFIANAPVWETPQFQALKAPPTGWDLEICRGDANTVYSSDANEQVNYINDDLVSNCTANIQFTPAVFSFNSCTGTSVNVYNTKIINGFSYDDPGEPTNSILNGCTTTQPYWTMKNTQMYNDRHESTDCVAGNGNLCATDPLVLAEAAPNSFSTMFGCNPSTGCASQTSYYSGTNLGDLLYLQASSPLRGAGSTSGVTYTNGSSNDYNNFPANSPPDIGAIQYNSCIANSTSLTSGFCSISDQCCGGTCSSFGMCTGSCSAVGVSCTLASQCCSDICTSNICSSSSCTGIGGSCSTGSTCCSGICCSSLCANSCGGSSTGIITQLTGQCSTSGVVRF